MKNQTRFAADHLLPLLQKFDYSTPIIDLGCGQGGVLAGLAECGVSGLCGIDDNRDSINTAAARCTTVRYYKCGIEDIDTDWPTALLCDVIEHYPLAIVYARHIVQPGGLLYVSFPPWRSPYGGHQQLTRWKLPWIHLFGYSGRSDTAEDVESVRRCKPTIRRLELMLDGWTILHRQKYFIRPELSRKGLPTIKAPAWMPEWMITGVDYVLRKEN